MEQMLEDSRTTNRTMKFDDVLQQLGDFGTYQQRLYFAICLPMAFHGIQTMSTVFTMAIPNHRCAIPGMPNDTYRVQSPKHEALISQYIPMTEEGYSSCHLYDNGHLGNRTLPESGFNSSSHKQVECLQWVFDKTVFHDTVITDTNLVCHKSIYRAHATTVFFIGGFLALGLLGPLADRFGRKMISYVLLVVMFISSHIQLWMPNIYAFIAFRFTNGFAFGALFDLAFIYVMEFIGPSKRGTFGLCANNFWGVGVLIQSGIAYGIRSWRMLQLAFSLPLVIVIAYWWLLPESPRWLLVKGHKAKAHAVLKDIAKGNGVDLDIDHIHADVDDDVESVWSNLKILLKHRFLIIRTLVVFWNWFVVSTLFFGLALNVSNLSGDLYVNFALSAIMEIVGYTICIPLMNFFGRKRNHVTLMTVGGICLLMAIVPELVGGESSQWLTTALSMLGKLVASASFATVYVYSSELFPTVLRGTIMTTSGNIATVGASVAPYVVELATLLDGKIARIMPTIVFGVVALSASLLSLLLPETANTYLPDNVEDMLQTKRSRSTEEAGLRSSLV